LVTDLLRTTRLHSRGTLTPDRSYRWSADLAAWAARRTAPSPERAELAEKAAEALADVPGRIDEAISSMRALLADRERVEPDGRYALSMRRLSLVRMLAS